MQTNAIMNNVDQSFEISEHVTLKRGLTIIEHVVHINFTDLYYYYKITNKKSLDCANLIKECITSKMASLHSIATKFPHQ
jgi:hypothetical protein